MQWVCMDVCVHTLAYVCMYTQECLCVHSHPGVCVCVCARPTHPTSGNSETFQKASTLLWQGVADEAVVGAHSSLLLLSMGGRVLLLLGQQDLHTHTITHRGTHMHIHRQEDTHMHMHRQEDTRVHMHRQEDTHRHRHTDTGMTGGAKKNRERKGGDRTAAPPFVVPGSSSGP